MLIRMMYVLPMILGRTYDVKKNTVGVDIFSVGDIIEPRVTEESFYRSNLKTVETSSDVKDILEINGDLSLNIKAGTLSVAGIGSYVKSSLQTQNSLDILIKVRFRTISKSVPYQTRPVAEWKSLGKEFLGTHFVQTIIYGGDLIARIRFKANAAEDMQEVRAIVKAAVSTGSVLDLVGEGKLESLDRQLKRKATMEINYFATVPLEGVPNNIKGLRDLVKGFKDHVKKVNGGIGVPVEVELAELSNFDRDFEYLKNLELETELEFFEEYLDDLLSTKSRLKAIVNEYRDTLTEDEETQLSKLSTRVAKVLRQFSATIGDLDLEKGSYQLDSAKEAYKEGKNLGMAGKFRRDLNRIVKKIGSKSQSEEKYSAVYTRYGSSECPDEKGVVMIHSGYAASSPKNYLGSGFNLLCLPRNPGDVSDEPTLLQNGSMIAGVKYGELLERPFNIRDNKIVFNGVVCAICLIHAQTVYTFYGRQECPDVGGWKIQYMGYVMTSQSVVSENVCVDSKLESHQDSYIGQHDQSLDFTLVNYNGKVEFIPCVVCSK